MPISAPLRLLAAAALIVPIARACSTQRAGRHRARHHSARVDRLAGAVRQRQATSEAQAAPAGETLTADLKSPDGTTVATADDRVHRWLRDVTVEDRRRPAS